MAEITASMVKELSEATGLGMMECKRALVESNGDFKAAEENPADISALSDMALVNVSASVEETRKALVMKLGENVSIRRFERYATTTGKLSSYLHGSKIGVLLDYTGGDAALGRDPSMHIAASKPKSIDASGVNAADIETERRIAIEKAREAGKPET